MAPILSFLAVAIVAGMVSIILIARRNNATEDSWDECSDLQGSPRTVAVRLPPAEILQIHDNEVRDV